MNISPHFKRNEFKCKCGKCKFEAVDHELLVVLEDLRIWFDEAVSINSAIRCETHNKAVGGAENSMHLHGIAADIVVKDITSEEVYRYLDTKYPNKYGVGLYPSWVHIDVRSDKVRWTKDS